MKRKVPRLPAPAKKVAKAELVGRPCRIATSTDAGLRGLEGGIVDETLHTLTLRVGGPGGRRVQVPKSGNTFRIGSGDDAVEVEGRAIQFRSWDRTKKVK